MKTGLILALVALAASATAQVGPAPAITSEMSPCQQMQLQVQQLESQIDATQGQAASCAAGGNIEPYNPAWAPWPIHAWPDAGSAPCMKMQAHATYIQTQNAAQIQQIQQNMNSQSC